MRVSFLSAALSFATLSWAQLDTIQLAFEKAKVPTDLHVKFHPRVAFGVTFPNGIVLAPGIHLPRDSTQSAPVFSTSPTKSLAPGPYVIAVVDPDAPTPQNPTISQYRHFLGGNYFIDPHTGVFKNTTAAITEYEGPNPPAGSDPHRYVFLLFKQPSNFGRQTVLTPATPITGFDISSFASQVGLGDPLGGNLMIVAPNAPKGVRRED